MPFKNILARIIKSDSTNTTYFQPDYSDDNYVRIYLVRDNERVKIKDELIMDVYILTSFTNLNLSEDNTHFYIAYDNLYELYYRNEQETDKEETGVKKEIDDYKVLNLPEIFKGYLYIENAGNYIVDEQVRYSFGFKNGVNLNIRHYKKNLIDADGKIYLLPEEMYELLEKLRAYNSNTDLNSKVHEQFSLLKEIKDYAEKINIVLNQRLHQEEKPIIIDQIKVDFQDKGEYLEVFPVIDEKDENLNQQFLKKFDQDNRIRNYYKINDKGKEVKVVFKNRVAAEKIKNNRYLYGEKKLKFLKGDNELFQDDNFDLSQFGPRVKGIGYLNYRAQESCYRSHEGNWFDLPHILTDEEEIILEPNDREIFEKALTELQKSKSQYIEVNFNKNNREYKLILSEEEIKQEIEKIDSSIQKISDIDSSKDLNELSVLCAVNSSPYIPFKGKYVVNEGRNAIENKRKTLLVKENLESEEYTEKQNHKPKIIYQQLELPQSLLVPLFEHQKEGLRKLQVLYQSSNINGFLLADDMGLGKTLQILSFLSWLKERKELEKALIVAPGTLLKNWDNAQDGTGEIQKYFKKGSFKTLHIQGVIKKNEQEEMTKVINETDIVFITYESLRLNNVFFGTFKWKILICDEIQMAKNPKTLLSVALKGQNAKFKIACSATPIENTLLDLWNIVDIVLPGRLGSMKMFKQKYIDSVKETDNLKEKERINNDLVDAIGENYLRRNKNEHLKGLPQKKYNFYFIKANDLEIKFIKRLNSLKVQGVAPLALIQKLIALCSHVALVSNKESKEPESLISQSSKLKFLKNILDEIKAKDEKVIIFTAYNRMQQILARVIRYWYRLDPGIVNGTLELSKRNTVIQNFKQKPGFNIIILSPLVAGVGLTLTEANHVIHYTRLWNPAKEAQATDRVYRIGQTKDVTVYCPIITYDRENRLFFEDEGSYIDYFLGMQESTPSPEERLNYILVKKKNLLNKFFLAASEDDIDVVKEWMKKDDISEKVALFDLLDDCLDYEEFKSFISLIYKRQGYDTYVISEVNDNGISMILRKDDVNTGLVCDFTGKLVVSEGFVRTLIGNIRYISEILGSPIHKLIIVSRSANCKIPYLEEVSSDITIISTEDLKERNSYSGITYKDILEENKRRFTIETMKKFMN